MKKFLKNTHPLPSGFWTKGSTAWVTDGSAPKECVIHTVRPILKNTFFDLTETKTGMSHVGVPADALFFARTEAVEAAANADGTIRTL